MKPQRRILPLRMKRYLATLLVVLPVTIAASNSSMHLRLVNAEPGINGTTDKVPSEIRLFYSQAPEMKGTSIRLFTEAQKEIPLDTTRADAKDKKIVFAVLKEKIGPGTYTVAWRAMAADGHVLKDDFTFTVKPAAKH